MSKNGTYDAHDTAKPGEPTFTLQGGDPLAPAALMHYADLVRTDARKAGTQKGVRAGLQRAAACEEIAWSFEDYQSAGSKPKEARASYAEKSELAAGAKEAVERRSAITEAKGHLSNARSTAEEARELLVKLGFDDCAAKIEEAQRGLRKVQNDLDAID